MKLIKCNHCGRPFYNEEKSCPYCGHAAHLSATNFVTKSISDPQSHKLMEDVLSGNYHPAPRPVHAKPEPEETVPAPELEPMAVETPQPEPEMPQAAEEVAPSESVQERAENIAAAMQQPEAEAAEAESTNGDDEVETTHVPRKRLGWVWILIIVILLAIAAGVYLKWDAIQGLVASILG